MDQTASTQSVRELVLARRRAMSTGGKAALDAVSPTRNSQATSAPATPARTRSAAPGSSAVQSASSRAASMTRRHAMSSVGKKALQSQDRTRSVSEAAKPAAAPAPVAAAAQPAANPTRQPAVQSVAQPAVTVTPKRNVKMSNGRAVSLARRHAMSSRGKAGLSENGPSAAQTARAGNPNLNSRELARTVREQRSQNGSCGQKKSAPCGRSRKKAVAESGAAADQPWKVGASATTGGQTVTGTMVGRSNSVTGDEPSTCRGITGTEYMGADIFTAFCQSNPSATPRKVGVTQTSGGNSVSGNRMGRGTNVTGNEPGTCKRVTGNQYTSAEQSQSWCGELLTKGPSKVTRVQTGKGMVMTGSNVGRSEKVTGDEPGMNRVLTGTQYTQPEDIGNAPRKVGSTSTLRGGSVTGTMVGRRERMTGDEAGSCRNVTGDEYLGQEQYNGFCKATPQPQDSKVGVSNTFKGKTVTGTMTGRSGKVTGDEPGSCKSVTGTPYAGADQFDGFCATDQAVQASARTRPLRSTPGPSMSGLQPGIGGKMTGDRKGACEPLTGTPYVGADQYANACPATPADSASPDFPQPMGAAPWQQFSVQSPSGGAQRALGSTGVTGNRYEPNNHITGPFGMAPGKVTGTEEARFGKKDEQAEAQRPVLAEELEGRIKSRITGEGQDSGLKITGDDWERGEHVTGTEGVSAIRRNPTIRSGAAVAAMAMTNKRNEELPKPNSKVTGGSGNTEKGSLITYSGGARG